MKRLSFLFLSLVMGCTSPQSKTGDTHATTKSDAHRAYKEYWSVLLEAVGDSRTPAAMGPSSRQEAIGVIYYESIGMGKRVQGAGHSGIYFSHFCADGPLKIRRCTEEDQFWGVVVARYAGFSNGVKYDFMAFPYHVHAFGTAVPAESPIIVTGEITKLVQDHYWEQNLTTVIPLTERDKDADSKTGSVEEGAPAGRWRDAVAASHRRDMYLLLARADAQQADAMADYINSLENTSKFNAFLNNCSNFVKSVINQGKISGGRGLLADLFIATPGSVSKAFRDHYQTIERTKKESDPFYRVAYLPQIAGSRELSGTPHSLTASLYKNRYLWIAAPLMWKVMAGSALVDLTSKPFKANTEYHTYGGPNLANIRYKLSKLDHEAGQNGNSPAIQTERENLKRALKIEEDRYFGKSACWKQAQMAFQSLNPLLIEHEFISQAESDLLYGKKPVNMFPKIFEGEGIKASVAADGFVLDVNSVRIGLSRSNVMNYDKRGAARVMIARINYDLFNKEENRNSAEIFDEDWNLAKTVLQSANVNVSALPDNIISSCSAQ